MNRILNGMDSMCRFQHRGVDATMKTTRKRTTVGRVSSEMKARCWQYEWNQPDDEHENPFSTVLHGRRTSGSRREAVVCGGFNDNGDDDDRCFSPKSGKVPDPGQRRNVRGTKAVSGATEAALERVHV